MHYLQLRTHLLSQFRILGFRSKMVSLLYLIIRPSVCLNTAQLLLLTFDCFSVKIRRHYAAKLDMILYSVIKTKKAIA